ncbi:hypothetical protein [Frankia sp. AiPa1]|uniref:hypothetical protein n=1 Tax=Frankia sp. AiPa1 TaxID=573492 RepID=UPI00202B26AE|nr:hypothetical protein [Frankia sp. AiPa1]MCL9760426.1 hypothetical protein [Frankia sp. AiPa1]
MRCAGDDDFGGGFASPAFSPDGATLATASSDGAAQPWTTSGTRTATLLRPADRAAGSGRL